MRIAFVVLLGANGLGAAALRRLLGGAAAAAPGGDRRAAAPRLAQLLPFVALGLGVHRWSGAARSARSAWPARVGWLVALIALGAGIIWHQADPSAAGSWGESLPVPMAGRGGGGSDRRWFLLRLIGGGLLVVVGIIGILGVYSPVAATSTVGRSRHALRAGRRWPGVGAGRWRRCCGGCSASCARSGMARIREQERAEVAAMVHDQVLHTLALIQRNAGDVDDGAAAGPRPGADAAQLALQADRVADRALRRRAGAGGGRGRGHVRDRRGDRGRRRRENDERVGALVAAAREALVNAARHAKVQTVSLYAEAEQEQLSVFVRDRGAGFDLSTVEEDRHGVRGSIIGRMQRHGGRAEIRTAPGEGTEVRLTMPLTRRRRPRRRRDS